MVVKVLLAAFALVILEIQGSKIPSFIPLCKRNTPDFNACYLKSFNIAIKKIGDGIPEMKIRKFDPVLIESISLDQAGSSLALDAKLSNTRVYGLTTGKATFADVNLDKMTFEIAMEVPSIYMESNYVGSGKILSLVFGSKGTFNGTITGITAKGLWTTESEVKNGKTWAKNFKNKYLDIEMKNINMYFDNLFPNKEITVETNRAINSNIDILYNDVAPIIKSTINTVLADAANSVYSIFSVEELFPE